MMLLTYIVRKLYILRNVLVYIRKRTSIVIISTFLLLSSYLKDLPANSTANCEKYTLPIKVLSCVGGVYATCSSLSSTPIVVVLIASPLNFSTKHSLLLLLRTTTR
jgi:hypothetical protein